MGGMNVVVYVDPVTDAPSASDLAGEGQPPECQACDVEPPPRGAATEEGALGWWQASTAWAVAAGLDWIGV